MSSVIGWIQTLPVWLVLVMVFAVPASEAALFFGLFLPGETVILLAGSLAHAGALPLWSVALVATAGAVVGDQVGFTLGRRYGRTVVDRIPGVARRSGATARALDLVERRGAVAVLLGRWLAVLRALVPSLAGTSGMGRARFTVANAVGGTIWAVAVAVGGYLAGASYQALERRLGLGGEVLAGVVVLAVVGWALVRHVRQGREHRATRPANDPSASRS